MHMVDTKCQRQNPFARHPNITVRMPQSLPYVRAISGNKENISDFFGKLGSIYRKFNLFSKPMQIFNSDETGVSIVHKPGKVVTVVIMCIASQVPREDTHTHHFSLHRRKKRCPKNGREQLLVLCSATVMDGSMQKYIYSG